MVPDRINSKISSLRSLLRRLIFVAGVSRVTLIAVGVAALCLLTDWTFHLSSGWRLVFGVGSLAGVVAALHRFLVRPMLVPMRDDQLALLFERRFPELGDVLVSAVQLAGGGGRASAGLVAAVLRDAESAAENIQPRQVPKLKKLNRMALAATAAVVAVVAFSVIRSADARTFAARYLNPFGSAQWPRSTELIIKVAGSKATRVRVPKGEQVAVKVTAVNARGSRIWTPPKTVWLDYENGTGEKESRPMRRIEGRTYQAYFNDIVENLVVSARARDARTDQVRIEVFERPRVEDTWLSLEYPKYTRIPPQGPHRSVTEVRAIVGTRIKAQIRANTKLRPDGARVVIDPTGSVVMGPTNGNGAAGSTHQAEFVLAKGMRWFRIELVDEAGLRNEQPRTVQLQVIEDKPPAVKILKPGGQTRCTPYALVPLEIRAKDDLALRSAWLRYMLGPKEKPRHDSLGAIRAYANEVNIATRWDISELGVKVGQTIAYRAEADDYRDVFPAGSGQTRQVGKSDEYFIKIVSSADLASELDRRLFALRNEVKKIRARQEEDRRKGNELLRKMSEGRPMTNDDRSLAADAENVQRELGRATRRIAEEIGKVREQMQDNRIGSFADRRRLDDTKSTLENIANTDMPRAADFIKNARKDLASRDGRDNLQTAAGIQATIIAGLDKVLASMSHNEDIDNLVRAARELLRRQRAVKGETADFAKRPGTFGAAPGELKPADLAALNVIVRRQRAAHDEMRSLEQDMLNVYERLKERDTKRAELVRQAQLGASRDQIRPMMEEAAAKLTTNRTGLAASHQNTAIKGLERLLEMLENARQEPGSDQALSQAVNDVTTALEDVRRLRKQQEGHASDAAEINRNAAQARRLKEIRRELNRLRKEQEKTNAGAKEEARLKELAERERKHEAEADEIEKKLDREAGESAERQAPQTSDIEKGSKAVGAAKSLMSSATGSMQKGEAKLAARSGKGAGDKLTEADGHLARALETIEKKRLEDTKETGLKQGETEKEARQVAEKIKQLARENESTSKEASDGLNKAGDKVGEAGQSMKGAHTSMERNDIVQGERAAKDAAAKLAEAEQTLQKLRDDLERKQREQKLLDLIVELQPMLEKQIEINDETRRIDGATAREKLPEPSRPDKVRLGQLAADESRLAAKADEILKRVEGEDAPVFVWGCQKLIKDMNEVQGRLVQFETDSYTQDVEKDIADTLRMLIDALKREQSKMREGGGGGGCGGTGGKPMLVPPSAQLKLLKARELLIHNQTKRIELKRLLAENKRLAPLQKRRVRRLAEEQAELADLTTKLAESLEREVRERQRMQEETE